MDWASGRSIGVGFIGMGICRFGGIEVRSVRGKIGSVLWRWVEDGGGKGRP